MTSRRSALAVLAILLSIVQVQCSDKDAPIRDEPESNGSEPRTALVVKYETGKYEMINVQDMVTKGTVRVDDRTQNVESTQKVTQWINLNVSPYTAGKATMTMKFSRIRQETKGGPMSGVVDSNNPRSMSGNPAAKAFGALTEATITMKCDEKGNISDVSGMNEVWDRMARSEPGFRQMAAQFKQTLGDKAMGQLLNKSKDFMPAGPVGVGAVWYAQFALPIPMLGDTGCEAKCKLVELKKGADGQTAIIDMKARGTSKGKKATQIGPGSMTINSMKINMSGRMEMDVESGMMAKQTMTMDGEISLTMKARGQEIITDAVITGKQEATCRKVE